MKTSFENDNSNNKLLSQPVHNQYPLSNALQYNQLLHSISQSIPQNQLLNFILLIMYKSVLSFPAQIREGKEKTNLVPQSAYRGTRQEGKGQPANCLRKLSLALLPLFFQGIY